MNKDLEKGKNIVERKVEFKLEEIWEEIIGEKLENYQIFIWGSTVKDNNRSLIDLDIIVEYYSDPIDSDNKNYIESRLMKEINISEFKYIDPYIFHKNNLERLILESRVDKIYNVNKNDWIYF